MTICVIIAAWNAERTISRAIRSALVQLEVSEVIVVDDASSDSTAATAQAADDGSGRLKVLRQRCNGGPSAARNRALETSEADYVAVLDADDYLLPGRFAALLRVRGWDAIADNIAFVPEERDDLVAPDYVDLSADRVQTLTLCAFINGSITRRKAPRSELGFLKPVIRREFLDTHGLRYDEALRLGEDFALYARMLAAGARFLTIRICGYIAVERRTSLSGNHATADLASLLIAVDNWAAEVRLHPSNRAALARYRARLSANYRHRRLIDDRHKIGLPRAMARLLDEPLAVPRVVMRVLSDKLFPADAYPAPAIRYLLKQ